MENSNDTPSTFSPFDAPVKQVGATGDGIKIDRITDSELDGKTGANQNTQANQNSGATGNNGNANTGVNGAGTGGGLDAPEFVIPNFNDVPNANLNGDPFAPGSGNNNKKSTTGAGQNAAGGGGAGNGGGGAAAGSASTVDSGFAKEFAEYTAKWLVDIFFRLLIKGFRAYAQIDKSEILSAVNNGLIDARYIKFVDEYNDGVEKKIDVSESEKKFVIEPLKYFMEVKKIQLKPEWMFLTSLLVVSGSLFMSAMDVKKQGKTILDRIIKESADIKAQNQYAQPGARKQGNNPEETVHEFNQDNYSGQNNQGNQSQYSDNYSQDTPQQNNSGNGSEGSGTIVLEAEEVRDSNFQL